VAKTAVPVELVGWLLRDDGGANAGQLDGHPPRQLLAPAGARWRRYVNALGHDRKDALEAGVEAVKVENRLRAYPDRDVRAGRSWTERGGHETVPS